MRKCTLIHTLIIFLILGGNICYGAKQPPESFDGKGYVGTLPDLNRGYEVKETPKAPPEAKPSKDFNSENELKPVPKDNPAFVNIILKPDKTTPYLNDIYEIVPLMENLSDLIEDNADVQLFNAKVYYFNKSVEYLRDKYKDKPESQFVSFKRLMDLNTHTKSIALLRNEAQKYNPYLAYGSAGYIYNPNNINEQMEFLKKEIEEVILILKDAN
jgi:hypothetical protein